MKKADSSILLIYTGGTIGMKTDPQLGGALRPFDFSDILEEVPELREVAGNIDVLSFNPLIDSSDIEPKHWQGIASAIEEHYDLYDGFVILHGTDTMAYSASTLSFMLENLSKSVIFTGSQLPLGVPRTDGRENLVSAVEIAGAKTPEGLSRVPEVTVFFGSRLMRGNRTVKTGADSFDAFTSPNLDNLAASGISIRYNDAIIRKWNGKPTVFHKDLDTRVSILKMHPGITPKLVSDILFEEDTRAVIIETYGAGNSTSANWFIDLLRRAETEGKILVNVTQCLSGKVDMSLYATGRAMEDAGVISGRDSTTEAMLGKLFCLLASGLSTRECKECIGEDLRGEISL